MGREPQSRGQTLINLYNARLPWLAMLHADLDRAVWAAYGWEDADPAAVSENAILARLLGLNSRRAVGAAATTPGAPA
jgi:hypothetical protein